MISRAKENLLTQSRRLWKNIKRAAFATAYLLTVVHTRCNHRDQEPVVSEASVETTKISEDLAGHPQVLS